MRGWVELCGSISRGLHVLACVCLCMHACMQLVDTVDTCVHAIGWMHVVGGFCCFSRYVGFSICRLCCYRCVSMETLSAIAALKTQHQSLCL